MGLERSPQNLVSKTEELLERKSSGSNLENRDYDRKGIRRADYATTIYPQKLAFHIPSQMYVSC
jgi:hypothetical protein